MVQALGIQNTALVRGIIELMPNEKIRPTKKQRELLNFIDTFITEHGYSPSYREIMDGCSYNSVATVALHVSNLIKRGHLVKRENSARSLEVVKSGTAPEAELSTNQVKPTEEKWLIQKIEHHFQQAEQAAVIEKQTIQNLQTLIDALKVLNLEGAAQSYMPRLAKLKEKQTEPEVISVV